MKKDVVLSRLSTLHPRSAWRRGVLEYAAELVDHDYADLPETWAELEKTLLNGAESWDEFSYGGNSLIYDEDVAARLCSPSELKRVNGGRWHPNRRESWLDVQARACYQAALVVFRVIVGG